MKTTFLFLILMITCYSSFSQDFFKDPEALVRALYDEVTFQPGEEPDWELAKSMFLDEATVVLRYSREDMTVFDLQGWVDDFVTFIEEYDIKKSGFEESILGMHSFIYGDIASISVLFESYIPGTDRRNNGIDIFQMIRKNGKWLIVSIVNERPSVAGPIPEIFDKE